MKEWKMKELKLYFNIVYVEEEMKINMILKHSYQILNIFIVKVPKLSHNLYNVMLILEFKIYQPSLF